MAEELPPDGALRSAYQQLRTEDGGHVRDDEWEALLLGALAPARLGAVRDHIGECSVCADVFKSLRALEDEARRDGLIDAAPVTPASWARRTWFYAAAASLAIAIAGAALFWRAGRPPSPGATKATEPSVVARSSPPWLSAFPMTKADIHIRQEEALAVRGVPPPRGEAPIEQLGAALEPYRRDDFAEAAKRLEPLWREYPRTDRAALYLGVSLLFMNRPDEAIAPLRAAAGASQAPVAADAKWYLALALARSNQPEAAAAQLGPLCDAGGKDAPRACAALQALPARRQP